MTILIPLGIFGNDYQKLESIKSNSYPTNNGIYFNSISTPIVINWLSTYPILTEYKSIQTQKAIKQEEIIIYKELILTNIIEKEKLVYKIDIIDNKIETRSRLAVDVISAIGLLAGGFIAGAGVASNNEIIGYIGLGTIGISAIGMTAGNVIIYLKAKKRKLL